MTPYSTTDILVHYEKATELQLAYSLLFLSAAVNKDLSGKKHERGVKHYLESDIKPMDALTFNSELETEYVRAIGTSDSAMTYILPMIGFLKQRVTDERLVTILGFIYECLDFEKNPITRSYFQLVCMAAGHEDLARMMLSKTTI